MHRLLVLTVALGAFAACTSDAGGGIVIRQNLANDGASCSFSADSGNAFIARGTIALQSPLPYVLTPLLESNIVALDNQVSQRTIQMRGARVSLSVAGATQAGTSATVDTASFPAGTLKFTSLFAAPLAPNGGLSVGQFDIVPASFLAALAGQLTGANVHVQVVAEVKVYGTLGGDEIESDPYYYPVTVCNDCIINTVGACPIAMEGALGNPCNPYQDGQIDCCTAANGQLLCPAPVASTLQ